MFSILLTFEFRHFRNDLHILQITLHTFGMFVFANPCFGIERKILGIHAQVLESLPSGDAAPLG